MHMKDACWQRYYYGDHCGVLARSPTKSPTNYPIPQNTNESPTTNRLDNHTMAARSIERSAVEQFNRVFLERVSRCSAFQACALSIFCAVFLFFCIFLSCSNINKDSPICGSPLTTVPIANDTMN